MSPIDERDLRNMLHGALVVAGIKQHAPRPDSANEMRETIIEAVIPIIKHYLEAHKASE